MINDVFEDPSKTTIFGFEMNTRQCVGRFKCTRMRRLVQFLRHSLFPHVTCVTPSLPVLHSSLSLPPPYVSSTLLKPLPHFYHRTDDSISPFTSLNHLKRLPQKARKWRWWFKMGIFDKNLESDKWLTHTISAKSIISIAFFFRSFVTRCTCTFQTLVVNIPTPNPCPYHPAQSN